MSDYARGVVLVLLTGLVWSLGGVLVRSVETADAWQISFWRAGTMAITGFAVVAWRARAGLLRAFQATGRSGLLAAVFIGAANICFILALTNTTVANTMFILAAQPLLVALLAWLALREPVRRATWFAMAVAFTGVAVMIAGSLVAADVAGTGFAIACAMAFSLFVVALRAGRGADMVPVITVAGALVMLVGLGASGGDVIVPWRDIAVCVLMGSVQVTLGLLLFIAGARLLPAVQVTLLSQLEIVLGPLWVFFAYSETPSEATLAGGVLVLAAVVGQAVAGRARAR